MKAGHVKTLIACHFPQALPALKGLLYSIARRKDLARIAPAPHIAWFHDLVARGLSPQPVAIDAAKDVAVQQYTGGTTGLPKGAMLSHANIAANMSQIDAWGCGIFYPPSKVVARAAVLPHLREDGVHECAALLRHAGRDDAALRNEGLPRSLEAHPPQRAAAVPTLIQAISKLDAEQAKLLDSLDVVVSAAPRCPTRPWPQFAKVSKAILAEGYGLTEASPVVCCAALRVPSKPMSIGLPCRPPTSASSTSRPCSRRNSASAASCR